MPLPSRRDGIVMVSSLPKRRIPSNLPSKMMVLDAITRYAARQQKTRKALRHAGFESF
jgi:hypothetical protein